MSPITATGSCLNIVSTPNKLLVRLGPCKSYLFKDVPLNVAPQSNTTRREFFLGGYTHGDECTEHVHPYRPTHPEVLSLRNLY